MRQFAGRIGVALGARAGAAALSTIVASTAPSITAAATGSAAGTAVAAGTRAAVSVPPPALPFSDLSWAARVATQPAANLTLGRFHVSFEMTQFGDVVAALGGVIAQQGDAGNRVRWLCYSLDGRRRRQLLWLHSDGETGGRDQVITAISAVTLRRERSPISTAACPAVPVAYLPVSFDNGVWLGMRVASLERMFGAPAGRLGTWSGYRYQRKGGGTCRPAGFDVLNSLQWRAAGGVVTAIHAGQVSSC